MTTLRGILIDPVEQKIEEIQLQKKDLFEQLYKLVRCDLIECATRHLLGTPMYLFFDEEGRFKDFEVTKGFALLNDEAGIDYEIFCGAAVLLGPPDKKGDTLGAPAWCTVEAITPLIKWPKEADHE